MIDLLGQRAEDSPNRGYAYSADGLTTSGSLTYRDLDRSARQIGSMLRHEGVGRGVPVVLLFGAGLDFIRGLFGCFYAGAAAVPVEPPDAQRIERTLPRLRTIARDCGAVWVLTTAALRDAARKLVAFAPELASARWLAIESASSFDSSRWSKRRLTNSDLALVQYTSGSTRDPHGVILSHGNLLHNQELIRTAFRHRERDFIGVSWLPVYHDMGLIGMVMQPMYVGGDCVLMSPLDFLTAPHKWLAAISTFRATTSGAPNFAYELCTKKVTDAQLDSLTLDSWEVAFCGAEPVRQTTLESFAERFAARGFRRSAFLPCYGLAEGSLLVSGASRSQPVTAAVDRGQLQRGRIRRVADEDAPRLVGCGTVAGDQDVAIVNERDERLGPDHVGEICVSGRSVGLGYWGKPNETAETFAMRLTDGSGPYLRTGDLGFLDENGELFVTGRKKDVIIVRGLNYYAHDVEAAAEIAWPGFRQGCAAAFALESAGSEDAVVVCEYESRDVSEGVSWSAVVNAVRGEVAQQVGLALRRVVVVARGQVPKTASGKVQRAKARTRYRERTLKVLHEQVMAEEESVDDAGILLRDESDIRTFIVSWLSERLKQAIGPEDSLMERGLDSLDVVRLADELSVRIGRTLDPRIVLDHPSPAELASRLVSVVQ